MSGLGKLLREGSDMTQPLIDERLAAIKKGGYFQLAFALDKKLADGAFALI